MKTEWKIQQLSDIVEFNPKETLKKGVIAKKISMDKLQPFCRDICEYELTKFTGGTKFRNGDTIMARITPCLENGKTAKINILDNGEIGFGSTEYIVFRAKEGISDPDFIYYLVTSSLIREPAIKSMVGSSGRQRVQSDVVEKIKINLPPLPVQKKIAGILKSLDDKIELNRQISKNLEEQARCLFDKMFPDSHKGKNKISDFILPQKGNSLQSKDAVPGSVPVVAGGLNPATYHNVANTSAPVITISASGANAGYVKLWNIPVWSSDSSYIDNSVTTSVYFWYILLKKRQNEIFDAQTGSAQPHIYPSHIGNMPMCSVSQEKMEKFHIQVTPLFELIGKNILENQKLSSLRDTLLPKLMNREIEVSDMKY